MPGARRDAVPVLPGGGDGGFGGGRGARVGGDAVPDKARAARGVALPLRHDDVGVLDHQEQLDPVVLHLEVRLAPGHRGDHAVALIAGVRQRVTLLLQIRAEPVECLPVPSTHNCSQLSSTPDSSALGLTPKHAP